MTTTDIRSAFEKYKQDHRLPGNTIWRVGVKAKHGHVGMPHFTDFEAAYGFFCVAKTLDDVTALKLTVINGRSIGVDLAAWEREVAAESAAVLAGDRLLEELALFGARLATPQEEDDAFYRRENPYKAEIIPGVEVRWGRAGDCWVVTKITQGKLGYIDQRLVRQAAAREDGKAALAAHLSLFLDMPQEGAAALAGGLVDDEVTYQAAIARRAALAPRGSDL